MTILYFINLQHIHHYFDPGNLEIVSEQLGRFWHILAHVWQNTANQADYSAPRIMPGKTTLYDKEGPTIVMSNATVYFKSYKSELGSE